ncbi:hypothetical protein M8C13_07300 [Crossiella sp. SN42]|uniref:hypothetical protein n=1 Tax=Crossiella sp. SN42 TaxID=2944808 RepID=UPI00207C7E0A|nr:hypothetical protein [Crossiella sp. SN42]MCO1575563.1 hypothetical protein [Crossiella sp. SN42]
MADPRNPVAHTEALVTLADDRGLVLSARVAPQLRDGHPAPSLTTEGMQHLLEHLRAESAKPQLIRHGQSYYWTAADARQQWFSSDQHGYFDISGLGLCWRRIDPPSATTTQLTKTIRTILGDWEPSIHDAARRYARALLDGSTAPASSPDDLHRVISHRFGHPLNDKGTLIQGRRPGAAATQEPSGEEWFSGAASVHAISCGLFEDLYPHCLNHQDTIPEPDSEHPPMWTPVGMSTDYTDPLGIDIGQLKEGCRRQCNGDARAAARLILTSD